jgi:hypothetical protein
MQTRSYPTQPGTPTPAAPASPSACTCCAASGSPHALPARHRPHPRTLRAPRQPPALPRLPRGPLMASSTGAKARTELNVAIVYVDRAARRLANEPGHVCQARTLEHLSGELAEVLAKLITTSQHDREEAS